MISKIINWLSPRTFKCFACDGDTIIAYGGIGNLLKRTIRMVGIDCPEATGNTHRPATYYGDEAKAFTVNLLGGKYIKLASDKGVGEDKYGRLLAYIYLDDVDVGGLLLQAGTAKVYNYLGRGFDKLGEYSVFEQGAKTKQLGMWKPQK